MMTKLFALLAVAGSTVGCSTSYGTADGPIDYRRSSGLAAVVTQLHVEPDGTATYTKASAPATTLVVPAPQLAALYDQATAAHFEGLDEAYHCQCADVPQYQLTVEVDGAPYMVQIDQRADIPSRLDTLLQTMISLDPDQG